MSSTQQAAQATSSSQEPFGATDEQPQTDMEGVPVILTDFMRELNTGLKRLAK